MKDCVCNCRRDGNDRRFSCASGSEIRTIHQNNVDLRNIRKARNGIPAEGGIEHFAVFESHLFTQRRPESHDDSALDLFEQVVRIDNWATLECFAHMFNPDRILAVNFDFDAGRHVRTLFCTARKPHAKVSTLPGRAGFPIKFLRGGFEYGAQPLIIEVGESKLERIHSRGGCELIHEAFARKIICGGGEAAIRAMAQWWSGIDVLAFVLANPIWSLNR